MSPPTATEVLSVVEQQTAKLNLGNSNENKVQKEKSDDGPAYPFYYPYFDLEEKFPPIELFEHTDPGSRANKAKPNLLKNAKLRQMNPYLGTIIENVQISQLSKEGLDELALFTAERKVLVFRNQDFKDIGPERQIEIARHFGPIHKHPTSGNVKGYPEFHVVYRAPDVKQNIYKNYFGPNKVSNINWHTDITFELQPSSTTILFILEQPEPGAGGDTLYASQVEAYNRLSPAFQKVLEGLKAVHSALDQAEDSRKRNGPIRRDPIETEHPIVRVHPVTGEKALFVNPGFTRRIAGFREEESKMLLQFLFDHISKGADFQIRVAYEPGTVVIWDNRITVHSATNDFGSNVRRHAIRLTPQAEVPIPVKQT